MAATREEADEWVNFLQNNNLSNPILQLMKRRRNAVAKHTAPRAPPQATLPPIAMDDVDVSIATHSAALADSHDNFSLENNGSSSSHATHNTNHIDGENEDTSNIEDTVINISTSGMKSPPLSPVPEVNWNHEITSV